MYCVEIAGKTIPPFDFKEPFKVLVGMQWFTYNAALWQGQKFCHQTFPRLHSIVIQIYSVIVEKVIL